jgi:hypothetical protein
MANEINYRHDATGVTLYAIRRNAAGQIWNGSSYVTQVNASWATYAIALTETPAGGYLYLADAADAAGDAVEIYRQAGATPAITDVLVAAGSIPGLEEDMLARIGTPTGASIAADIAAAKASADGAARAGDAMALTADGLDNISAAEPVAKPTTFAGWLMWLVQRYRCADMTATTLTVKTEAGDTITEQAVSDNGTTQTLGAPE